jgi:hypothetical protein
LNHLGVEVESTDEVTSTERRLSGEGVATAVEESVACCYARQDKVWVDDPAGRSWEIYTVLGDAELPIDEQRPGDAPDLGCGPADRACC